MWLGKVRCFHQMNQTYLDQPVSVPPRRTSQKTCVAVPYAKEYGGIEYGGLPVNQSRCTADDFPNVVGNSTLEDRVGSIADMG